jgi:flavin reductase (DIM6/NTAB) family NADH-FMN oxidoreductase RutF
MRLEISKAYRLLSPRIVLLITTLNSKSGVNGAPVDFATPVSINPPIVMISLAPTRHTYQNIVDHREFVINVMGRECINQVLRCSTPYQDGVDKLRLADLNWFSSERVDPPRVKEAKAWIECEMTEQKQHGDHVAIFAEVLVAEIRDEATTAGEVDIEKLKPIFHATKEDFITDFKITKHKRYD